MGISFKLSRIGKRYVPQSLPRDDIDSDNESEIEAPPVQKPKRDTAKQRDKVRDNSIAFPTPVSDSVSEELEVSFTLNLFLNGFYVGKPNEVEDETHKILPYDRASKSFLSEIEYGCLPGDLLDDIPCKYVNGSLLCEIRDYRDTLSDKNNKSPIVKKVVLRLTMTNVIKDLPSISDDSWSYSDLLEAEARILKAMTPVLNLNPTPELSSFGENAAGKKIDLKISWTMKRKASDALVNAVTGFDKDSFIQNSYSRPRADAGDVEIPVEPRTIPSSGLASNANYNIQENRYFSRTCSVKPTIYIPNQNLTNFSNPLRQRIEPEKVLRGKSDECRKRPLVSENCDQQRNLEDIHMVPPGIVKDKSRDVVEFSHLAKNSKLTEMSYPSEPNEILNGKRENLNISQASSGNLNNSSGSCLKDSLLTNTSMPKKEMSESSLGESDASRADIIDRFLKIQMLTQRRGLKKGKNKHSKVFEVKPSFYSYPNLDLGGSPMKKWRFGNNTCNFLSSTLGEKIAVSKTRMLKFARESCASKKTKIGGKGQTTITENFTECTVDAKIVYEEEHVDVIGVLRLQSLPNSQYASLYADQFTKLMEKEGGYAISDNTEPNPPIRVAKQPAILREHTNYLERQHAKNVEHILECQKMEREKIELQKIQQKRTIMMLRGLLPTSRPLLVHPAKSGEAKK